MKIFLALLVLVITPALTTAQSAQPQTTNRASSHDRHHHRHSRTRHHRRQVSHHRTHQTPQ